MLSESYEVMAMFDELKKVEKNNKSQHISLYC